MALTLRRTRVATPATAANPCSACPALLSGTALAGRASTPRRAGAFTVTLLLALAGCANPGPPRPPSLNLPELVTDLHAERVGTAVHLTWTTGTQTTDELSPRGPLTAELCRTQPPTLLPTPRTGKHVHAAPAAPASGIPEPAASTPDPVAPAAGAVAPAPGAPTPASNAAMSGVPAAPISAPVNCSWRLRLPVTAGASSAADPLLDPAAPSLQQDPSRLLRYTVRIENSAGRAAGSSPAVFTASGAAPPPVTGLAVSPRAAGAQLTWRAVAGSDAAVVITRSGPVSSPPRLPALPVSAHRRGSIASAQTPARAPRLPPETHLMAAPADRPDAGGALDTTAPLDTPLTWRAERVRTVTLAGRQFLLRSDPGPPLTQTLTDTFPPAVPTGLLAVDGSSPAVSAVDLSWEPSPEPDLAGYLVFRTQPPFEAQSQPGSASLGQQLTPTPVAAPAFHDVTARPGTLYNYRVVAVDRRGNRSTATQAAGIRLEVPLSGP